MNALDLFRSGNDYHSIAVIFGTTEAEIEREIHKLRTDERIASRCDAARKTEDTKVKWQRKKAELAAIRRACA